MKRSCLDCGQLFGGRGSRCPAHAGARERRRGTPSQRGYGTSHRNARVALAEMLPAECAYCGGWISEGERWVAAHVVDGDPDSERVIAHPACNERAKRRGGIEKARRFSEHVPAPNSPRVIFP